MNTQQTDDDQKIETEIDESIDTEPTNEADQVQKIEAELAQMKDTAQRALADLQNFKRKADEERQNLVGIGQVTVLMELIPVLDNFNRAFQHIPEDLKENDWVKGISQIEKQFLSIIANTGLEEIPTIDQPLNPNIHEVITTAPGDKDKIVAEIEKGYTFKGKVLRASKVVVGQG